MSDQIGCGLTNLILYILIFLEFYEVVQMVLFGPSTLCMQKKSIFLVHLPWQGCKTQDKIPYTSELEWVVSLCTIEIFFIWLNMLWGWTICNCQRACSTANFPQDRDQWEVSESNTQILCVNLKEYVIRIKTEEKVAS